MAQRIAYFDCFAGISGDMALGALVDAGADFRKLKKELKKLGVDEYELTAEKVIKRGISATDVTVKVHSDQHRSGRGGRGQHGRSYSTIKRIVAESGLSEAVKARSAGIFRKLGQAESKIHSKHIDHIHFHEVGAVDAMVDIVGTCICLELLGVEKVYASAMPTFTGTVEIAHGTYPLPAPATAELLKGVPWRKLGVEGEIVTPTGAAIVTELAEGFGEALEMVVRSIGYGAGKNDFGLPNVLRVMVGEPAASGRPRPETTWTAGERAEVAVLETNIDDLSPQVYEVVMERLFEAGALDVYTAPIQMKKNRPATLLSVICDPASIGTMSDILFEETSTIGIRIDRRDRICLAREMVMAETEFGPISVKVARRAGKVVNVQPEYEDCKAAASKFGVPFKSVRDAAVVAFYTHRG